MAVKTQQLLEQFGLSEKQSRAYLALLQLGKAGLKDIAHRSGLNRTTLYEIVDQLSALGLVNAEGKGWGRQFTPADPKLLRGMVESKRAALDLALPELLSMFAHGPQQSTVTRVEGRTEIRSSYDGLLAEVNFDDFYLVMTDLEKWLDLDRDYFKDFARRRTRKVRGTRLLAVASPFAEKRLREGEAIRILPLNLELSINLVITPRRVILHQMSEPEYLLTLFGTSIIEMFRQIFEILWNQAPPTKRPPL
jgi:sugar-specific transcriptional regulator TrmB